MANEAAINVSLIVDKRSSNRNQQLLDLTKRVAFRSDIDGVKGPLPGSVLVPLAGIDIDLSELTTPGLCWLHNQGPADGTDPGTDPSIYYVDVGIKDSVTGIFYPLLELYPGDQFPLRLSRNLEESYNATGTGTGPAVNTLHMISYILPCNVYVGAFEK